jgi:hypothetical protein
MVLGCLLTASLGHGLVQKTGLRSQKSASRQRNSAAFFLQAALPAVYSKSTYNTRYSYASGSVDEFKGTFDQFSLRGSIGFGLSVQGKFGSFDTHVSNMGWFLSFNKLIQKK